MAQQRCFSTLSFSLQLLPSQLQPKLLILAPLVPLLVFKLFAAPIPRTAALDVVVWRIKPVSPADLASRVQTQTFRLGMLTLLHTTGDLETNDN